MATAARFSSAANALTTTSRRTFLQMAGLATLGAMVLSSGAGCALAEEASEASTSATSSDTRTSIENALNLANMGAQWSYANDAWTLSVVTAVTNAELPDQQGVSVCVPAAYVTGVDTDGDGVADVTADTYSETVTGNLVIDYDASVTSTNGQVYTASTAPLILNTGAAGYGSSNNSTAGSSYAAEGYVNIACGNRGKQDQATDADGNTYYTGDAPCCLVDQKNAARFVKYNILLGNLPGDVNRMVSTGGSGGGAHAAMFAATSNNPDFYDYEIEAGAVGVYRNEDGSYTSAVTINGEEVALSDGAWGCIAYSAITSLYEGDMTLAFEYFLDPTYSFNTSFQQALGAHLASEYMTYINEQGLTIDESQLGLDIDGDGATDSVVSLTIDYDAEAYADTNGYGGTYLDLYLAKLHNSLQSYLNNLGYAEGWTWFDADGAAMSDEAVAAMTDADRATAFIEGRYAASSSAGGMGGMGGGMGDMASMGDMSGDLPSGDLPSGEMPSGETPSDLGEIDASTLGETSGELPSDDASGIDVTALTETTDETATEAVAAEGATELAATGETATEVATAETTEGTESTELSAATVANTANQLEVGTPDAGTTQSSGSSTDSANYASYDEMLAAYQTDVDAVYAGDAYGKNPVALYNPLNYIGTEGTEAPTWTRILMGASEGDMSMFASMNMQIKWLANGTDSVVDWQWNGGHVPSEILGDSFALYVDEMFGKHVEGAVAVTKPAAEAQTTNGDATEATGTDLSSWVEYSDTSDVYFTLASAAAYRTAGASKACPGFDVIDYGQEDYVFGTSTQDARHWDEHLVTIFENNADELSALFNGGE